MVVDGRLVGTFEPARVMVVIAHATSASARENTIAPSQPAETTAGMNGKGMSQLSASPASTASAHAIGGRTTTFAVSAVSAMAGPVNLRSLRCGQPKIICKRSAKSPAVRDLPVGAHGRLRHHGVTANE